MRRLAAAVAVALSLGACGIPSEGSPRVVSDRDVPFGLLESSATAQSRP